MPHGDAAIPGDSLVQLVKMIVWSPEAQQAAIDGAKRGLPACRGVDVVLQERFPQAYLHPTSELHQLVEDEVAEVMRRVGSSE